MSKRTPEKTPVMSIREPVFVTRAASVAQFREALIAALYSLSNNRLRSLLTTIGIVVGVAAMILVVAMGTGITTAFQEQYSNLANQITITPAKGAVPNGGAARNLTDRDVAALQNSQRSASYIASVSPAVLGSVTITAGQAKDRANMVGATENYLETVSGHVEVGQWLSGTQVSGGARVVIIGQQAFRLLYGQDATPSQVIGQSIRLAHSSFRIQGVLTEDGQNDNVVMVPFSAARTNLVGNNGGSVDQIIVKSTSADTIDKAESEVTEILDSQHLIRSAADRDFNVRTFTEMLKENTQFFDFLSMFIVSIAAISLLVGGIGVANIMLVSVTERTREIGIRKAIGAPRRAIMRQFLSEAVMLTGLGGLIGVLVGIGITMGLDSVLKLVPAMPVPILTVSPVLTAFAVSLGIGIVAGGYPASRAARLQPIQALRYQ